ncbi:hypothetical protein FACS1894110_21230 [Spirochaetia bacterium]|nr:hypothetical protein FACS1894110_21230 [Spirochaetia bacterium]
MNNSPIQDPGLSWAAKGLLAYFISLPETWVVHLSELYSRGKKGGRSSDGRAKTESAMNELIKAGYVKKIQGEDYRNETEYIVYESSYF